jgi:hypothetical protein
MLTVLPNNSSIISPMVSWIFTLFYNGLLAERFREPFGALSVTHARSIRVVFIIGAMDHMIGDDVMELWLGVLIGYFGVADGISILG